MGVVKTYQDSYEEARDYAVYNFMLDFAKEYPVLAKVIILYHGLESDSMTFKEISEFFGWKHPERARYNYEKGIRKLRHPSRRIILKYWLEYPPYT